jgi:hypothetical protein
MRETISVVLPDTAAVRGLKRERTSTQEAQVVPTKSPQMLRYETPGSPVPSLSSPADDHEDDLNMSLTNLQWLQDLRCSSGLGKRLPSPRTPTVKKQPKAKKVSSSRQDAERQKRKERAEMLKKVNWKKNGTIKPPHSYATLIYMAIRANKKEKVTLGDIYNYITRNFLYYKKSDGGWKVRPPFRSTCLHLVAHKFSPFQPFRTLSGIICRKTNVLSRLKGMAMSLARVDSGVSPTTMSACLRMATSSGHHGVLAAPPRPRGQRVRQSRCKIP